jgi:DNA-binding NarL/FixJ family response regulator
VESIRTVTVTLPRMLSDIIASLVADRARLNVVARLRDRSETEARFPLLAPDLILIGLHPGESDAFAAAALALVPTARVVALSFDGRDAYVHEAHARRAALLDVSPAALVDVIMASRQPALAPRS